MSSWQREHRFAERPYNDIRVAVTCERERLYQRIEKRVDLMMEQGLLDEVRMLLKRGFTPDLKAMRTIGYRECAAYLNTEMSFFEALARIKRDTRRYAKRQLTWLRHEEEINWLEDPFDSGNIVEWADRLLC
jgi:tRNA dimethylallyltransferase